MTTHKAPQRTDWLCASQKGTPSFVGSFFENIAGQMLYAKQYKGGEFPVPVDLEVSKARAIVEVKACGCGLLRLRRPQFDAYQTFLANQGYIFFDIMPFLVFFYKGRIRTPEGKTQSVFKVCRDRLSHWRVLASQTTDAYLLDHELLDRLPVKSLKGIFPDGTRDKEKGSSFRMSQISDLLKKHGGGLSLTQSTHRVTARVKIGLVVHQMRFRFTAILSQQTREQMGVVIPQLVDSSGSMIIRRLNLE